MQARRFDALTRLLAVPAHRRALLRGAVMGGIVGRLTAPAPAGAVAQQTAVCDPVTDAPFTESPNPRFAETFVAAVGGKLSRVEITIDKTPGTSGDFVVRLHTVDPASGIPTNKVLASKKVANSNVPAGQNVVLTAKFKKRKTTKLAQGSRYAVVISRPNANVDDGGFAIRRAGGDPCTNKNFFYSTDQTNGFSGTDPALGIDMLFEAFVGF